MSRTPVSEFNARMGLDISPLEQAVPRAIAQFKRLSAAQVALSSTTGGPDIQSISEKVARAASSVGRVGLEGGGSARFKTRADELAFAAPLGDANEASLKRTALRQQEMQRAQKAASDAYMADIRMIDTALEQTASRQMQRAQERQDFEESIAQRRIASAQTINEFETQRSTLIRNSAKESAAAFQAEFKAVEAIAAKKQADFDLVEGGLRQLKGKDEQRAMELIAYEDSIAQRRMASAQAINEFDTQRSSLIQNSARASAAVFQAEFKAAEDIAAKRQADFDLVENGLKQLKNKEQERAAELIAYEDSIAQRRMASAQAINEFETQRSNLIQNSARESAAVFQAEFKAAEAKVDKEREIADIRRKAAQVQTSSKFDVANPFKQQVIASRELIRLLEVRKGLQRGTVEFAQAELAVTQQIARVRGIRDNLTVGAEGMRRLGNTAADSQKGFSRFGLGMQQVGYQVQDFAVQVASGTNAMVALSQQGSQLLGFFGGFRGAIAGAVLSVGVLVFRLLDTKEATKQAMEQLRSMSKELIRLNQARNAQQLSRAPLSGQVEEAYKSFQIAQKVVKLKKAAVAFDAQTQASIAKGGFFGESASVFGNMFKAGPLSVISIIAAKAVGYDALTISTKRLVEQTGNLVDAENELNDSAVKAQQILDTLISSRENVLNTLNRDRKPLVDEKELQSLIKVGAITKDQAEQVRLLATYSKGRSEWSRPDNEFITLDLLGKQLDYLKRQGLAKTDAFKETNDEYETTKKSLETLAKRYKDQLDPLHEQKRVWKEISDLRDKGFLNPQEATDAQAKILRDINLARKMPDSMQVSAGVLSSGLSTSSIAPNQLLDVSRQMLSTLRQLVTLETVGARGY